MTCIFILLTFSLLTSTVVWSAHGEGEGLRIVFAGDIMGHGSQIRAATMDSTGAYDYIECFRHLQPILANADIAVGNLEVTLAGPPFKGYPQFSSPDALADALLEAGFHVLVNANNHALDRGKEGLERTQEVLADKGLIATGSFISRHSRSLSYPLLLEKNGILLALLNYTYGTNSLKADTPNIVNYIDTLQIAKDLNKARLAGPDFVIACMHWGREYEREEHTSQRQVAGFLFRHGVHAIIGSHPHVVQPVYYEKEGSSYLRPVVYSLGNLVSNQRDRYRDGGIIVGLELQKTDEASIAGLDYLPVWVHKTIEGEKPSFRLVPANITDEQIRQIGFTDEEYQKFMDFCKDTREHLSNVTEYGTDQ